MMDSKRATRKAVKKQAAAIPAGEATFRHTGTKSLWPAG